MHDLSTKLLSRRTLFKTAIIATLSSLASPIQSLAQNQNSSSTAFLAKSNSSKIQVGTLEVLAELPIRPALVTVNRQGRIFATVHWFDRQEPQLIEITGRKEYKPYPNAKWNRGFGQGEDAFDQPLGILVDAKNRVWTVDCGIFPTLEDGQPPLSNRSPRLLAFDTETGENVYNLALPKDTCPPGTYPQDLAIDEVNDFAYLADIGGNGKAAIVVINLQNNRVRRFEAHPSLSAENVDLMVEGKRLIFPDATGKFVPARIGINPITLSADNETLFFGAMCSLGWYSVSAQLFRDNADDSTIAAAIKRVANKPICDGVSTDAEGNHFLTNLGENAIDRIDAQGQLTRLVQDARLIWADGVRFGLDSWLYISVNQLNRSPLFSGAGEQGKPPYTIMRVWTGTKGIIGR
jgi:sugar lactone lactonase YvrE